ncbi:hypothetical protein L6452_19904 [Arctium lappa]|uniref:Uncharacterized protein n=1 Tax=Arctium lappa TaxID=4217 RepID=A0ACB9B949_ARCLA|nr:hypothetical protein L6452_19904 [Arctium lappa]
MSAADDGIDFDFGPTTEGKKKAFKFDKMDMDFSLDAEFDKSSSFKMDMCDLDISSPSKKPGKSKERSKEASSGREHSAKRDSFAFPFDFEEFADLDFEPRKTKIDEKSNKSKDKEGHSNTSGSGGSGDLLAKDVDASSDNIPLKHPASPGAAISKIDTQMDKIMDSEPRNEDEHLESVIDLKPSNAEEKEMHKTISTEEMISCSVEEPIQEYHSSEKRSSPEPHAQQVAQYLYDHSLADNVSTKGTISDVQQEEFRTVVRTVSLSTGAEQNGNVRHVAELVPTRNSSFENSSAHMNSQSQKGEMCKAMDDNLCISHIDGDDTSKADSHLESSITLEIENLAHGEMIEKRNGDSSSKLHMGSLDRALDSGVFPLQDHAYISSPPHPVTLHLLVGYARLICAPTVDELVSEKGRENIRSRSKYFTRQNGNESELQKASVSRTKLISVGNKRMSTLPNNPALEKRELDSKSVESGSKFTGISRSPPKVLSRDIPVQTENTETGHVKGLDDTRQCLNADNTKPGNEPMMTTVVHDIGPSKEEPVSRSDVHPSSSIQLSKKDLSQNGPHPGQKVTSMTSTRNMSKIVVEKNRISPTKAETRTSEVSSLKVSRATEQKLKPLNSLLPKGLTSMRNKEQGNMVFKRNPSVDTKKQTPSTPTLKRKTYEDSSAIPRLTPLKRLSASPSRYCSLKTSNNIRASAEKVVDEQVCNHANVADEKSPGHDVSLTEMDRASAIENDDNVEKAEACSKELEDICNMLKKKHEEAKDILVRAIVNNNNLLMLNHPIYQDKISFLSFHLSFACLYVGDHGCSHLPFQKEIFARKCLDVDFPWMVLNRAVDLVANDSQPYPLV